MTGYRIVDRKQGSDTTWMRKSQIFRLMWRKILDFNKQTRQYKKLFREGRTTVLRFFGLNQKVAGLIRRPRLLGGPQTERLIAINASNCMYHVDGSKVMSSSSVSVGNERRGQSL